jgi:hypothetical protein
MSLADLSTAELVARLRALRGDSREGGRCPDGCACRGRYTGPERRETPRHEGTDR